MGNIVKLTIEASNDACSDVKITTRVSEYYFVGRDQYIEKDAVFLAKVRKALKKVEALDMLDIDLEYGSETGNFQHVDAYRIIKRNGQLKAARHNGAACGAVYNFNDAPIIEEFDIMNFVRHMRKKAKALYQGAGKK